MAPKNSITALIETVTAIANENKYQIAYTHFYYQIRKLFSQKRGEKIHIWSHGTFLVD